MILGISALFGVWPLLIAFFLFTTYRLFLRPYFLVRYYKKQGAESMFFWNLTSYIQCFTNAYKHDDFYLLYRRIYEQDPKTKVIAENFGGRCMLSIVDTDMIKELMKRYDTYHKDTTLFGIFFDLLEGGMVNFEGAEWKTRRKIISSAFNFEFTKLVIPMVEETAHKHFNDWIKTGNMKEINLVENLGSVIGVITGKFFFGQQFEGLKLQGKPFAPTLLAFLTDIMGEMTSASGLLLGKDFVKLGVLPRHRKINRTMAELRAISKRMIDETVKTGNYENNNLLSILLKHRGEGEGKLNEKHITGEFTGIFIGGTDTTAHLCNSAIYFLWKNPHAYAKVKEEVDREFKNSEACTLENLNRMDYLSAFIRETMRLGGPVAGIAPRVAVKDDDLLGFKIRKGTLIQLVNDVFYRSELFFTNPLEFLPERWLDQSPYTTDKGRLEPHAFMPFSAGPRNCLGQHLAVIEAKIVISMFVRKFTFSFPEDYKFRLIPRLTFEPIDPLIITLEPRRE